MLCGISVLFVLGALFLLSLAHVCKRNGGLSISGFSFVYVVWGVGVMIYWVNNVIFGVIS